MVDHSLDEQIAEIPENILLAIASMTNPTVEGIRRKLPGPKKDLAEELAERHGGSAVAGEEAVSPDTVADTASRGEEGEGVGETRNSTASIAEKPSTATTSTINSAQGAVSSTSVRDEQSNPEAPSDPEAVDAPVQEQPEPKRLNRLAQQAADLQKRGRRVKIDEADFVEVSSDQFAEFEYGASSLKPQGRVRAHIYPDGDASSVEITWTNGDWPVFPDDQTLFRVIASDRVVEVSPEAGDQIIATQGNAYVDKPQPGTPVRHYQVWAYVGADLYDILDCQPFFVGETLVVFPIEGVEVQCSDGVVEGNWNYVEQYDHVQVFASLENSADRADSPKFRLSRDVKNHSFKHETNLTGQTMRYAFKPYVNFRDNKIAGKTVVKTVEVKAVLQVPELEAYLDTSDGRGSKVNLAWYSPPAGNVRIYFTPKPPSADLTIEPIPESALDFDPAISEGHKAYEDPWTRDGAPRSYTASWPSGWTELHITPVTVLNDEAVVGNSKVLQQVGEVTEATIVERTSQQLVNFVWPAGADIIRVEVAPRGASDSSYREPRAELDRSRYIRDGGVRLKLNPDGESVFLTPLSTFAGVESTSDSLQLDYPGLTKYFYSFELVPGAGFKLFIWKEGGEDLNPPKFVGVYHPIRLPLAETDANDIGASILQISTVQSATGELVSEAGANILLDRLPGSEEEARNSATCLFVNFSDQSFDPRLGGRLRLFIRDEAQETHMPRRILLDTRNMLVAG